MSAAQSIKGRLRLGTGLVLFAFLATHLANHALGLLSVDTMERGRLWFLALWRNPFASILLYGSLATHLALALWSVFQRRSLRMPVWQALQLILGLMIPPLLAIHIIGTRLASMLYDVQDSYTYELLIICVFQPASGIQQAAVLVIAWIHACIGLHYWLRLRPWYPRLLPLTYGAVLLVPVLGLLGFVVAGRDIAVLAQDTAWLATASAQIGFPDEQAVATLYAIERWTLIGFAVAIGVALTARGARSWVLSHRTIAIAYPDGRRVEIQPGTTVLEASRMAGIPHASICGGRGRCSTCRIRISKGLEHLPSASAEELRVLERVGAPPNVRLACQTRPTAPIAVVPLLPPTAGPRDAQPKAGHLQGHEEEIAVLFADLRAFTRLAEQKLPYDVVFLLNRYFRAMGTAIEDNGGQLDKFIGDGVMALFGVGGKAAEGCRQALAAARDMSIGLRDLNASLANDISEPLRIGIGLHAGPAIVGEMGHGRAMSVTAVGDTVNTASRLEALTKDYDCQLVFSDSVSRLASIDIDRFPRHLIDIRGRVEQLAVYIVSDAQLLGEALISAGTKPRQADDSSRVGLAQHS